MLFALSLIETRQAVHAMIEIAKEQEAEISNLAKEFITSAIKEFGTIQGKRFT